MNVEHLTNEELANVVRDFRDKMIDSGGRAWSLSIPAKETGPDIMLTEIVIRLRTSIPKPVIKAVASGAMTERDVTINGHFIAGFMPVYTAEIFVATLRRAIGIEGDEQ